MGLLIKSLVVSGGKEDDEGNLVERDIKTLFRTGYVHSVIRKNVANEICDIIPTNDLPLISIFGEQYNVTEKCVFETTIDDKRIDDTALILENIGGDEYDMVIGLESMQRYEMELDLVEKEVKVGREQLML